MAHNPFRYWGDSRGRLPLNSRTCQRCQQDAENKKKREGCEKARRKRTAKPEPTISEKASSGVVNAYKTTKNSGQTPYPNLSNSMSAPSSPSKRTAGEELWLVHQRRTNSPHHDHADDEDDHDYEAPAPRKRSRSIGEELFLTHLKRAVGLDPDYDTDPEVSASSTSDPKGKGANEKNSVEKKTPTDVKTDDNTMRLRDGRIIQHKSQ